MATGKSFLVGKETSHVEDGRWPTSQRLNSEKWSEACWRKALRRLWVWYNWFWEVKRLEDYSGTLHPGPSDWGMMEGNLQETHFLGLRKRNGVAPSDQKFPICPVSTSDFGSYSGQRDWALGHYSLSEIVPNTMGPYYQEQEQEPAAVHKKGWREMLKTRSAKSLLDYCRAQQEWQIAFNVCPKSDPLQVAHRALCWEWYRGCLLAQVERVLWLIGDVCHGHRHEELWHACHIISQCW